MELNYSGLHSDKKKIKEERMDNDWKTILIAIIILTKLVK